MPRVGRGLVGNLPNTTKPVNGVANVIGAVVGGHDGAIAMAGTTIVVAGSWRIS